MKRILIISGLILACAGLYAQEAKDNINFLLDGEKKTFERYYPQLLSYRLEVGFIQDWQNSKNNTIRDLYNHGANVGFTLDVNLPYNMSVQTGVVYSLGIGRTDQHFSTLNTENPQIDFIRHDVISHQLLIPIRYTYTQPVWKRLALYFYTGPELVIGLAQQDNINLDNLSEPTRQWIEEKGVRTASYDRYKANELRRFAIRWGLGGGIQWDTYRLYSGYSFGLNNLSKQQAQIPDAHLWQWGWHVTFAWQFH